jgi:hypothetical protein
MRKIIVLSFVVFVVAIVDGSCTRHNPLSCCTTQAQCQMFGLDKPYACDSSLVCNANGTCVMPECQTSADCASTTAPVCIGQLCVPLCTSDTDCVGIANKPHCATDGACVGCLANSDCGSDAPICDATARACRGCAQDSECTGGVCLEATGKCQLDAGVIFVIGNGGVDSGTCTRAAPCATLQYGLLQVGPTRNVIHVDASVLALGSSTVTISNTVYIDGTNTTFTGTGSGALFDISGFNHVVLSNATVSQNVTVEISTALTAYNVHVVATTLDSTGGTIIVEKSTFASGAQTAGVTCKNGSTTIAASTFDAATISTTNCGLTLQGSKLLRTPSAAIETSGGLVTIENNVVIVPDGFSDAMTILSGSPGSTVRFNTIVNTTATASDGSALACDSTITVTSNIFAYNSLHPITNMGVGCTTRYSLFDSTALPSETAGVMDKVGDVSTFFVDSVGGDYHLGPNSPALKSGEPNLGVTKDLDGNPRPAMSPDIGAFQAP